MAAQSDLGEIINAPPPQVKPQKIVIIVKSEIDVLDDGYKWRKYGKKMVKGSPFPRNYYKCFAYGCSVKKRIERDRANPENVITSYEGIHNHLVPS